MILTELLYARIRFILELKIKILNTLRLHLKWIWNLLFQKLLILNGILSKHGKLLNKVLIEPVSLNATTVKAATGNNAAFIVNIN